ncbi:MAG: LysE family transporter [Bacteroidota bacterium]
MPAFLNGLLFGLVFIFAIGPSFFLLIQNSIQYGFRKGAFIALGISLSDVLFVSLSLIGMATIFTSPENARIFSYIAASILIVYGIYSFIKTPVIDNDTEIIDGNGILRFLMKGFLINVFNPTIILFWITLSTSVSSSYSYSWPEERNFFIGMLVTILVTDLAKAYLSNHVRSFITVHAIRIFNRVVGSALVLFALSLLFKMGL